MKIDWVKAEKILKDNGVGVIPTDTLYGLVGKALSKKAVEKIYKIKGRNENKPFIVLIHSLKDLEKFGVNLSLLRGSGQKPRGSLFTPFVSVILPCKLVKFNYLHRGTKSIAFRMIGKKNINLFNLIKKVGPIVAPSANKEDGKPAETIKEAKKYFGNEIDFYIDGGKRKSEPSTLIRIENGEIEILRQGKVKINKK